MVDQHRLGGRYHSLISITIQLVYQRIQDDQVYQLHTQISIDF
jgi:hypothetical protein